MPTATMTLNPTKNDLAESVRGSMIKLLQARLTDAIDIQLQAKQAHWNVKGASFIALHELFDKVAADAQEWVDETAERIVQLGGVADGRARTVAAKTSLPEYPLAIKAGAEHVEAFSTALGAFGAAIRKAIDEAGDDGDEATADILTEIARGGRGQAAPACEPARRFTACPATQRTLVYQDNLTRTNPSRVGIMAQWAS